MRRSRSIQITILASASLALAACDNNGPDPSSENFFPDTASCTTAFGQDAASECASAFQHASVEHAVSAPRFTSQEACREATGGNECQMIRDEMGRNIAIPIMAGIVAGAITGASAGRGLMPVYAGRPTNETCPEPDRRQGLCEPARRSGGSSSSYIHSFYTGSSSTPVGATRGDLSRGTRFQPTTNGQIRLAEAAMRPRPAFSSVSHGGLGATGRSFSSSAAS
ncbi:DUF1190 domain-containing protein [Sabulicella rubraurantiaca]|uniref:DUF1190 domain-containing protein n=1 Tax=Sabulicella rubraurantiaca TaxID=2811429 RepID=UPI001A958696|nr:DUF1190 domain-containing protein [Sabulicella rubraurantiaca]